MVSIDMRTWLNNKSGHQEHLERPWRSRPKGWNVWTSKEFLSPKMEKLVVCKMKEKLVDLTIIQGSFDHIPKKVKQWVMVKDQRDHRCTKRNLKTRKRREQRKQVNEKLREENCQLGLELVLQKRKFLDKEKETLDRWEKFLQETSNMLSELLKDQLEEKETNKF